MRCALVLRALLIGEEFEAGPDEEPHTLRRRLLAAFIRSIDAQTRMLRGAVYATMAGGALTAAAWVWILGAKMAG